MSRKWHECKRHSFKIIGSVDNFLLGWIYYQCRFCGYPCQADRFFLFQQLKGRTRSGH